MASPPPPSGNNNDIYINSGSAVTEAKIRGDWCSVKYTLVTGFPGLGGGGAGFPGRECVDYRGALDESVLTHGALERAEMEIPSHGRA